LDSTFRQVFRQTAEFPYSSRAELRSLVRTILAECADDVFVTPSAATGWESRVRDYGRNLLATQFDTFVSRTFKVSAGTQ
jgi:hypothetical protein